MIMSPSWLQLLRGHQFLRPSSHRIMGRSAASVLGNNHGLVIHDWMFINHVKALDDPTTTTHTTTVVRHFAGGRGEWKRTEKKRTKKPTTTTKPKKPFKPVAGDSGRIVLHQKGVKKQGKKPKLCSGCGTEVMAGGGMGFAAGPDAVDPTTAHSTKRNAKKARYFDATDTLYGQNERFLCDRCKNLQKASSEKNSKGIWHAYDALADVSPDIFRDQLKHIVNRRRFGLCIMVVDATDPEHSAVKHLRRSIGSTPCWLVLNKIDLLPRMNYRDRQHLRARIETITGVRSFDKCFSVSATANTGILELTEELLGNLRGRDVFVVGSANVGKSTLVKSVAGTIASAVYYRGKKGTARRDMASNLNITASNLPGTTLQAVRIPCFPSHRHALWDTPGIINQKAVQYSLFPSHLMEPLTRPEAIPIPTTENGRIEQLRPGQSLLMEAAWMDHRNDEEGCPCVLARIDVANIQAGKDIYAQYFLHPSLRTRVVPTESAPDRATIPASHVQAISRLIATEQPPFQETYSLPLKPYVSKDNPGGEVWPSEKEQNPSTLKFFMDICFASLGWVSFKHHSSFALVPHCVEGSVFSKRASLYPANLATLVQQEEEYYEEPDEREISRRLKDAARMGRHQKGKFSDDEEYYDEYGREKLWYR